MGETSAPAPAWWKAGTFPAVVLGIGDLVWSAIAWIGNFDFVLSMEEQRIAMIFQSLLKWGWIIILLYALFRFWAKRASRNNVMNLWELAAYFSVLAFMAGVLLGTWATEKIPHVVVGWGTTPSTCLTKVDTSRLVGYLDRYKVAVICSVADPTQDWYEDTRVAVSVPYTITGGEIEVAIPLKATGLDGLIVPGTTALHNAFLFPKDEDPKSVKKLSDIKKYGGIPLTPPKGY